MMDTDILTLLSPNISHFVIYLLREGDVGICKGQIKVTDLNSRFRLLKYFDFSHYHMFSWVGSESPCRAELPSAYLHSLFFQIHPRRRFFINNFYLISSHRLKSISGTTIIIVNNNNFDFIAILLLAGGLKTTAE